jgi:phosphatidylinositol alpha-1,6-mannosyltransferase
LRRLLLLSPSLGLGGGIERVGDALLDAWPGRAWRVNLREAEAEGRPSRLTTAAFGVRSVHLAASSAPDLVFCLHAGLLPVGVAAAAASGAPLALWAHGTEVWHALLPGERRWVRRCSFIFASSSFTREWLGFRAGIPVERVSVLPLPIARGLAARARAFREPHTREPIMLTLSRVVPEHRYKGHFAIAESMPHVLAALPEARWVVAGDGADLPALRALCRELGIEQAVTFTGTVPDAELSRLYGSAGAFVLPSVAMPDAVPPTGEGLGLVYVEAGAFGVPSVVSSLSGGSADFVVHGETGLCAPPGRAEWLARPILRLLTDAELNRRLGHAARERALARHTPEVFASELARALSLDGLRAESRERA